MNFEFSQKAKRFTFGLAGLGLVLILLEFVLGHGMHGEHKEHFGQRFMADLLVNGIFFFAVSLGALFYTALHYATESGWGVVLKRVFEGVFAILPFGMAIILVVLAIESFVRSGHGHSLYHWMVPGVHEEGGHHYDEIIANKSAYLNQAFFWIRTLVYMATFYIFAKGFRKRSLLEDQEGGTNLHFTNFKKAALFLVLFAVFSSTLSWDWIMSIDTHWFSTLFGWYTFAGMWLSAMVFVLILTIYLKGKGYLEQVNESHIHDMGKWVFALSFLWSYLWFSQFMLIWYSNIPEEVIYYIPRIEDYRALYFSMFLINFAFPMVLLMSREAKRSASILIFIGGLIFFGHWLDVFMMITPGTMGKHGTLGFLEIGSFALFLGVFIYLVLNALTKRPLMVKNHPYLDESIHHEI